MHCSAAEADGSSPSGTYTAVLPPNSTPSSSQQPPLATQASLRSHAPPPPQPQAQADAEAAKPGTLPSIAAACCVESRQRTVCASVALQPDQLPLLLQDMELQVPPLLENDPSPYVALFVQELDVQYERKQAKKGGAGGAASTAAREAAVTYAPASISQLQAALGVLKQLREKRETSKSSSGVDPSILEHVNGHKSMPTDGGETILSCDNCGEAPAAPAPAANLPAFDGAAGLSNGSKSYQHVFKPTPNGAHEQALCTASNNDHAADLNVPPVEPMDVDREGGGDLFNDPKLTRLRVLLLLPVFSALRSAFPLNGTFFQTNEVFLDSRIMDVPVKIPPRFWSWMAGAAAVADNASPEAGVCDPRTGDDGAGNLVRDESNAVRPLDWRGVYFGTSAGSICRDMSMRQVSDVFSRGLICIKSYNPYTFLPSGLPASLVPTSVKAKKAKVTILTYEEDAD